MFSTRGLLAAGLLALAGAGAGAQPAQPKAAKTTPIPLVVALLPYLGDEGLQKELGLTADQSKKLLAYRQKVWDEAYNTASKDLDVDARNRATEAEFKAVLSADQLKRANQLAAQIVWAVRFVGLEGKLSPIDTHRVSSSALTSYPAVADPLRLDETQKKLLAGSSNAGSPSTTLFLMPAQTATAKELLGTEYAGTLTGQRDPRPAGLSSRGGIARDTPLLLQSTIPEDVRAELNLTADQLAALAKLARKRDPGSRTDESVSLAARLKAREEFLKEQKQELAKILDAAQTKRLAQLEWQQLALPSEFAPGNPLGKELDVTDAQRVKYEAATATYGDAVTKAVLSGDPIEKVRAALAAAFQDREKAVAAILTPGQQTRRKELLGAPFAGQVERSRAGVIERPSAPVPRLLAFGRYVNELTALTQAWGLRDELKLTDGQIKKLAEAARDQAAKFPGLLNRGGKGLNPNDQATQKQFADQSAFIEKVLADVLTRDQRARFRELMLQRLGAPGAGKYSLPAACYPGMFEALKLSDVQANRLVAGDDPADVLTADQKKAVAGMLGKPADVEKLFRESNLASAQDPPSNLDPVSRVLLNAAMWDGLKLTPEQVGKLVPPANAYLLVVPATRFVNAPLRPAVQQAVTAAEEELVKAVDEILTPTQRRRLDQYVLQRAAGASLDLALTGVRGPEGTAKALALTPEQVKKIHAVGDEVYRLADLLSEPAGPRPGARRPGANLLTRAQVREIELKMRDRLEARVLAELTDAQRAKWKELTGDPFPGLVKRPLSRGDRTGGLESGYYGP